MELTTEQQTTAFLWAFVLGAVIEGAYFLLALYREIVQPGKISIIVTDFLFMFSVFGANYFYAVAMTEGKVRFYVMFAQIVSFAGLYFPLGRTIKCRIGQCIRQLGSRIERGFEKLTKNIAKKWAVRRQRIKISDKT